MTPAEPRDFEPRPLVADPAPDEAHATATPALAREPQPDSRRRGPGSGLSGREVLALQRSAGNAAVSRLLGGSGSRALQRHGPIVLDPPKAPGDFLLAPNVDAIGVPYAIRSKDYRADAPAKAPSFQATMPVANIKVPDAIPGWKTMTPEKEESIGPFKYKEPAREYIVTRHSPMVKSAWDAYKSHLIPGVQKQWNDEVAPTMNSFTQAKQGDPALDDVVAVMKNTYGMNISAGKGTVSSQVGAASVGDEKSTSVTASDTALAGAGSGLEAGLKAAAAGTPGSGKKTPVQAATEALRDARRATQNHIDLCRATGQILEGAGDQLEAARKDLVTTVLESQKAAEEGRKADIESGQATLEKIVPEIARVVAEMRDLVTPLKAIKKVGEGGAKLYEGNVGGALDMAKGVMAVAKWDTLQKQNDKIMILGDAIKDKHDNALATRINGLTKTVNGTIGQMRAQVKIAEDHFKAEKKAYDTLADVVEANLKRDQGGDGKLAANALRAIPLVDKLIRFLRDVRDALPKQPVSIAFNVDIGYTLAKDGVNAPGVSDLLEVAGWIKGARPAVETEIAKWEAMLRRLQMVSSKLGA